jgi:hypothetical protein
MPNREKRSRDRDADELPPPGMGAALNGAATKRPFDSGLRTLSRRTSDVRHRIDAWAAAIRDQAREHPGRSVALALGAGYVLGGGLFSVLTARLAGAAVRIGLRVAVVPLVTDSIAALGDGLMGGGADADEGSARRGESSAGEEPKAD